MKVHLSPLFFLLLASSFSTRPLNTILFCVCSESHTQRIHLGLRVCLILDSSYSQFSYCTSIRPWVRSSHSATASCNWITVNSIVQV
ncbi:hypothetical protein BDV23DRAFT_40400 [Aspergillus alliaceus]|uniref:Secreted protein n=1 Tax=Petromyces alliaceus TaxID=209559 RepID=A0A5N7BR01_PETAA|nr:hypothetical protein BDV23DRAFT_40400 [Aspergillus alliaceus]